MRIAFVCDWYLPRVGGIEHQMRDVARELVARGHDVRVLTATPGPSLVDGVGVERLRVRTLPRIGTVFAPDAVRALDEVIARDQFELVHAHSLWSPLALLATFVARRRGVPSVLSNHSLLDGTGITLFRALDHRYGWSRWPDALTAPSMLACDETASASRRPVVLLSNCVDVGAWAAPARQGPVRQVASVLRLTSRKAPLALVAAIPRVLDQLAPSARPRFVVAGDGPLRARVERAIRRAGIGSHIELRGTLSRQALGAMLAESQLFVHPTVQEAFGIALLEARASGLPIVAMRGSGARDAVDDEATGLLADDEQTFADHIATLISDDDLRRRCGAAAPLGLARWSIDAVAEQHLALYRRLFACDMAAKSA